MLEPILASLFFMYTQSYCTDSGSGVDYLPDLEKKVSAQIHPDYVAQPNAAAAAGTPGQGSHDA